MQVQGNNKQHMSNLHNTINPDVEKKLKDKTKSETSLLLKGNGSTFLASPSPSLGCCI